MCVIERPSHARRQRWSEALERTAHVDGTTGRRDAVSCKARERTPFRLRLRLRLRRARCVEPRRETTERRPVPTKEIFLCVLSRTARTHPSTGVQRKRVSDDASGSDARIDDDDDARDDEQSDEVRGETRGARERAGRTMARGDWLGELPTKRGGAGGKRRRVCDAWVVVDAKTRV